jgi:hypothetical protein
MPSILTGSAKHGLQEEASEAAEALNLTIEVTVKLFSDPTILLVRLFWRGEASKVFGLSIYGNERRPSVVVLANAFIAGFVVVLLSVLSVLRVGRFTKVCYGVVRRVAVDVVENVVRPLFMDVKPRQAMNQVSFPVDKDGDVSIMSHCPGDRSRFYVGMVLYPSKNAGNRVVGKEFFKTRMRQWDRIALAHGLCPQVVGSGAKGL